MLPSDLDTSSMRVFVNPSGKFVLGGPHADAGLTGRKIIVDTYGGMARHGGGAFSGKDPSKVDRSAAYAARWVAKHVVASGAAERCEVQVAYAIGVARPVSVLVETFGTERVDRQKIAKAVDALFDLRPGRHHPRPRPASSDLPAHGRLRPLRANGPGLRVGADAPARRPAPGTVADLVARAVRVITEVAAVDRPFDYRLGESRRPRRARVTACASTSTVAPCAAWVVGEAGSGRRAKGREEVAGLRAAAADELDLLRVGERRWYSTWSRFLLAASPSRLVTSLPAAPAPAAPRRYQPRCPSNPG